MINDRRMDLRLFLEDMECPVVAAQTSTATRPTASITVLATKKVRELVAGTTVVLGYRDVLGEAPGITTQTGDIYSVLFIGMLTGLTTTVSAMNRTATLLCHGHSRLLDRFYTYITNTGSSDDLFGHNESFVGASAFFRSNLGKAGISSQIQDVYTNPLPPYTPGLSDVSGPARGAIKLIESCVGVVAPPDAKHEVHGAQHEYFSHAHTRTRLMYQIGAISSDSVADTLIGRDQASAILGKQAAQSSDLTTLMTILDILLKNMYYGFLSIGAPVAHRTATDAGSEGLYDLKSNLLEKYKFELKRKSGGGVVNPELAEYEYLSPTGAYSADIFCDILRMRTAGLAKGSGSSSAAPSEGELPSPEAVLQAIEADSSLPSMSLRADIASLVPAAASGRVLSILADNIYLILSIIWGASSEDKSLLVATTGINRAIETVINEIVSHPQPTASPSSEESFMRVLSYLMAPNLTFCTPPRCNVLFPNQLSTFSLNRPLYDLPTRLLLHSEVVEDGAKSAVKGYYAPTVAAFKDHQGHIGKSEHLLSLLEHERFTGVVPSFASLSYLQKFKAGIEKDLPILRVANFNLMLQRYGPVTISASGPFNPFAAVGFPIAFIDVDEVTESDPSIYVGLLTSVAHSYSGAGQASTMYSVTHVREVGEVDDMFRDVTKQLGDPTSTTDASNVDPIQRVRFSIATSDADRRRIALESFSKSVEVGVHGSAPSPDIPHAVMACVTSLAEEEALNPTTKVPRVATRPEVMAPVGKLLADAGGGKYVPRAVLWDGASMDASKVYTEYMEPLGYTRPLTSDNISLFFGQDNPVIRDVQRAFSSILTNVSRVGSSIPFDSLGIFLSLANPNGGTGITGGILDNLTAVIYGTGKTLMQFLNEEIAVTGVPASSDLSPMKGIAYAYQLIGIDEGLLLSEVANGKTSFFNGTVSFGNPYSLTLLATTLILPSPGGTGHDALSNVVVEELYRPPWYSAKYSVANIGRELYSEFLKVGSVQDAISRTAVPPDASTTDSDGAIQPTYTTRLSLSSAYAGYRALPAAAARERFVEAYTRRPIANVLDVYGEGTGLLTAPIGDIGVVDAESECADPEDTDHSVPAKTSGAHMSTEDIIEEIRERAGSYISSTKGDAFR